jgi:hypothetical protein
LNWCDLTFHNLIQIFAACQFKTIPATDHL